MDLRERFLKGENGRHICSCCEYSIPADIQRVNFPYRTRFGTQHIRICSICILKLANLVGDKEEIIRECELKEL